MSTMIFQHAIFSMFVIAQSSVCGVLYAEEVANKGTVSGSTGVVPAMGLAIVESSVEYAQINFGTEVSQVFSGMVERVRAFPPAAEPAVAHFLERTSSETYEIPQAMGFIGRNYGYRTSSGKRSAIVSAGKAFGYQPQQSYAVSPLLLDLTGTGQPSELSEQAVPHPYSFNAASIALFDIDGDGFSDITEWPASGMAILVHPLRPDAVENGEGTLRWNGGISGADLVGNWGGYRDGFEHLSAFDKDKDSLVGGAELAPFLLWTDGNGNALPEEGELHRLETLGVSGIRVPSPGEYRSTFMRSLGPEGDVWDWWPTYYQARPDPGIETGPYAPVKMTGYLAEYALADLISEVFPVYAERQERLPVSSLEALGFNASESILADIDADGRTLVLFDYAPTPPHLAREWILVRQSNAAWRVVRFSLPFDTVQWGGIGRDYHLLQGRACDTPPGVEKWGKPGPSDSSQLWVISDWCTESPQLRHVVWYQESGGFRCLWGAIRAAQELFPGTGRFYLPGYFYGAGGAVLSDALAEAVIEAEEITLSAAQNAHVLLGNLLPERGYLQPLGCFVVSPTRSYVQVRAVGGATLLLCIEATVGGQGWSVREIDSAPVLGLVSADESRVQYIARRAAGKTEMCWMETGPALPPVIPITKVPAPATATYPVLGDNGTKMVWAEFDWSAGTAVYRAADALRWPATGEIMTIGTANNMAGALRCARQAPVFALQTQDYIIAAPIRTSRQGAFSVELSGNSERRGRPGGRLVLAVEVLGTQGSVTYRWYFAPSSGDGGKGSMLLPGENGNTLALDPLAVSDSGMYYCEAEDDTGLVESTPFTVWVTEDTIPVSGFRGLIVIGTAVGLLGFLSLRQAFTHKR